MWIGVAQRVRAAPRRSRLHTFYLIQDIPSGLRLSRRYTTNLRAYEDLPMKPEPSTGSSAPSASSRDFPGSPEHAAPQAQDEEELFYDCPTFQMGAEDNASYEQDEIGKNYQDEDWYWSGRTR